MANVAEILREIDSLDEQQRLLLEQELARRAQAEWEETSGEARTLAAKRGIDQATIDRTIERHRYGR